MSTRCMIGAETEAGIRFVYVHCDGYPDGFYGKVETLQRLVARHGLSRVVSVLLETPAGWSSFDGEPGDELHQMYRDERFELVPHFGIRYTLTDIPGLGVQGDTEYTTPESLYKHWDIQYVYLITADGRLRWAAAGPGERGPTFKSLQWTDVELVGAIKAGS